MKSKSLLILVLVMNLVLGNMVFWGGGTEVAHANYEPRTDKIITESSKSNDNSIDSYNSNTTSTSTSIKKISDTITTSYLPKPNVTVTTTDNSIKVSWDEIPGATEYVVNVNRDTAQFNNQTTYTITRALPEITYRIMVFGYDGTNYGESEILYVRLKEPAPIYDDAGRIDFTGKLAGELDQIDSGFTYVNWGLVNGNTISLFYKLDAIVQADVYVNDVKNTELKSQSSSSALINGLKPGEKNVIRLAWTNPTDDSNQRSLEFIIMPPAQDSYTLGDSKAGFGSIVDLKQFGKWYLVDDQTLISQDTVSKYIDIQGEAATWRVDTYSKFIDSVGYDLSRINVDKQSPFYTKWWTVNAFDNGEYSYGYSSPVGLVTKEDLEKYTGIVLSGHKEPNRMIPSLALVNPSTYESALGKSGNKGFVFTENASDSNTFPNNHMNPVDAGTLQNFRYKAMLKNNIEFKGQGTNENPYVIPTLAGGEPVITKLDKPRYYYSGPAGNNGIQLKWYAVEGAEQYILKRGSTILYEGPLVEYIDEGVDFNSVTTYTLVARKGEIYSEETKYTIGNVPHIPYPPDFRAEALDSTKVRLTWSKADHAVEYVITRNDQPLAVTKSTSYEDVNVIPDTTYIYKVIGQDGDNEGPPAVKSVKIPKVTEDVAPKGHINIRVNRVYDNRVDLQWNMVEGATQYEIYQDQVNKVWSGHSNTMIAYTLQPGRTYTYRVVASNKYGKIESSTIEVQTAGIPQSMNVAPMNASNATIAFEYQPIEGAVHYVERNPQTKYEPLGNGLYRKTYVNTATRETRDEGIVATVNGKLQFSEVGVERSKYYEYNIIAVRVRPDGSEEVIGKQTVAVTTPADGTGATVYGSNYPDPGYQNVNNNSNFGINTGKGNDSITIDTQVVGSSREVKNPASVTFRDIEKSYAKEAIIYLAQKGIVKGYSNGSFGGSEKVTRAEFAIFLKRAFGYNSIVPFQKEFTDVFSSAWYYSEIAPVLEQGIIKGFNDGTLRPNAYVTREQASSMIENVMKKQGYVLSSFTWYEDNQMISNWARNSINLVAQEAIMKGYPDGKFMPKEHLTRQEAAMIIYNLLLSKK
ncbi:S-layer homology domain-containing protein [Paenibacillus sp. AD87]|uniref:S-layer homology domain-containing protein n=1 Tax=Paenibacillus sp. AD87 TaxID=1528787 RepID=UPI0007E2F132|nr:S-layer homology domain-containing protein [Paenibacillus sp. AD87]OAX46268.1 Endo-1,4-beta-xylanase A [Paenibacillus sp. AD87]